MLASPGSGRTTAFSAGLALRLVPPLRLSVSDGLKPRLAQLAAWNGLAVCGLVDAGRLLGH